MHRHHPALQNDELYSEYYDMIKSCVVGIQREVHPIKKYIGDRQKEVVKEICSEKEAAKHTTLEFTRLYFDETIKELQLIEQTCEDFLRRLNVSLLKAVGGRRQPPTYLYPEELRRAYEISCGAFKQTEDETSCHCTWENKSTWALDDVQNILNTPPKMIRTEFDEYDIKFLEDIIYLRTKMFALPRKRHDATKGVEIINKPGSRGGSIRLSMRTPEFFAILAQKDQPIVFYPEMELSKISALRFIDGNFIDCEIWMRLLDLHGNQYGSKWYLVLRPQIEEILKRRLVPVLHLDPRITFEYISTITKYSNFILKKSDLIQMLKDKGESIWLLSWRYQFQTQEGKEIAVTLIQSTWRGYWMRKKIAHSGRMYIAASLLWCAWLGLKEKKEMHKRYLKKMLISLQTTRDLSSKLMQEYHSLINQPHVVIHLPSIGYQADIRRMLNPRMFCIYQNITIFRMCFVLNPCAEVVYVLPVNPTRDLLLMYSDFMESMSLDEDVAKRITFIALSQADTFRNRALNVSRILHCSEDSITEIKKKISGKKCYFLPCVVDECDMRLAANLRIPLLCADMEVQRHFLNVSNMCELIETLGLRQPPHRRNVNDFDTLCSSLAELMVHHTEVSVWMFKVNYGVVQKFNGAFLINHISVPFMPILRRERERYGNEWNEQPELRQEFYEKLKEHLPKVIPNLTRLSKIFSSWKQFYGFIQKYSCVIQGVPVEDNPKIILASVFVPAKATHREPKWLGTADKISLESAYSTIIYLLPQTSLDIKRVQPSVNKLAKGLQNRGYFGFLAVDCYCYLEERNEKLVVMLLSASPHYNFSQSYVDWMQFAIGGRYNVQKDQFYADVSTLEVDRKKSSFVYAHKTPDWNETSERFGVAITQLHHSKFSGFRWSTLRELFEKCDIVYDKEKRQGSSIILHDGEIKKFAKMVAVSPNMTTTLSMVHKCLIKLHKTLINRGKRKTETNLPALIDLFSKLTLDYENLSADKCMPFH